MQKLRLTAGYACNHLLLLQVAPRWTLGRSGLAPIASTAFIASWQRSRLCWPQALRSVRLLTHTAKAIGDQHEAEQPQENRIKLLEARFPWVQPRSRWRRDRDKSQVKRQLTRRVAFVRPLQVGSTRSSQTQAVVPATASDHSCLSDCSWGWIGHLSLCPGKGRFWQPRSPETRERPTGCLSR